MEWMVWANAEEGEMWTRLSGVRVTEADTEDKWTTCLSSLLNIVCIQNRQKGRVYCVHLDFTEREWVPAESQWRYKKFRKIRGYSGHGKLVNKTLASRDSVH